MDTTPTVAAFTFKEFILDIRRGALRTTAGEFLSSFERWDLHARNHPVWSSGALCGLCDEA